MAQIKNFDRFVKKCEVSYFIDRNFEGKGWATKAIREVIEYVFSKMDMEKIYCRIDPENLASIRVAEKCGFQLEGRLRREFRTGEGDIIDVLYYGIFKEKYTL
jgi:ribosomal-protein-serine acetyltransferase